MKYTLLFLALLLSLNLSSRVAHAQTAAPSPPHGASQDANVAAAEAARQRWRTRSDAIIERQPKNIQRRKPDASTGIASQLPVATVPKNPVARGKSETSPNLVIKKEQPASSEPRNPVRIDVSAAVSNVSAPGASSNLPVNYGDVLDILIVNANTQAAIVTTVDDNGTIKLSQSIAPLVVRGLMLDEISQRLTAGLQTLNNFSQARATVSMRRRAPHSVTIAGLVDRPGEKLLPGESALLSVVLAATQPQRAAGSVTIISPRTREKRIVDLKAAEYLTSVVRTGDKITVGEPLPKFFYITGQVVSPGKKKFRSGVTLTQAIEQAGLLPMANTSKVILASLDSDGEPRSRIYKLKAIKAGRVEDPMLQPEDLVAVSH